MKQRFDGLDVTAMAAYVQRTILGKRLVNIYDVDADGSSLVFKWEGNSFLLIESGVRFHPLSHFTSEIPMPTPFCAKLRKHLRSLRLEGVQQIGTDRVILFQFGAGPSKHALILELYAKGNLILCDSAYKILQLLRSHVYEAHNVPVHVGSVYPVALATSVKQEEQIQSIMEKQVSKIEEWVQEELQMAAGVKRKKGAPALSLKTLLLRPLSGVSQLGPALLEHCILHAGGKPHESLQEYHLTKAEWSALQSSLRDEGKAVIDALQSSAEKGFVLYSPMKDKDVTVTPDLPHADKLLQEFVPHLLLQHDKDHCIRYGNFGDAVADFFHHMVTQKRLQKAQSQQQAAKDKLAKIKQSQDDRLQALLDEQDAMQVQASAIEIHADAVDKALTVINSMLASGMDWDQLHELVRVEQGNGNPIAMLIYKLDLEHDYVVLRLPDLEGETIDVHVSLKESAYGNASSHFARYRAAKAKREKTIENAEKALKAADESTQKQLAAAQAKNKIANLSKRKPLWFEKFRWFVTSDNYLVLGGRDAHQNEVLVKRYLRPGDAYLHADVFGAASCILRAKRRRKKNGRTEAVPLSQVALREAGNFTICLSSAWTSRMVTSAYWVEAHQVSKTAPTGEYLTVGSFMIRGKKNFLPPSQLEMGLAVMFRLGDDDSVARHKSERRDFAMMEIEDAEEPSSEEEKEAEKPSPSPADSPTLIDEKEVHEDVSPEARDEEPSAQIDPPAPDDAEDDPTPPNTLHSAPKAKKKGLSVRDRRMVKKYGSLEEAERILGARKEGNDGDEEDTPSVASSNATSEQSTSKIKRGKKSKMKRAKKKYADQDAEDRELAMLALHGKSEKKKGDRKSSSNKTKNGTIEKQAEVLKETTAVLVKDTADIASKLPDKVRQTLAECVTVKGDDSDEVHWKKLDAKILEQLAELEPEEAQQAAADRLLRLKTSTRVDNFSSSLAGIIRTIHKFGHEGMVGKTTEERTGRKTKAEKEKEASLWKKTMEDEGVAGGDGDEEDDTADDTMLLNKLTGKPVPADLVLHAVPVCAPYQTLSQYAYRVKLTPGNMKRGKAAKACVDFFLRADNGKKSLGIERNHEMIKQVSDNDWVQVVCSDVKISAAGASKAVKNVKAKGKNKGKN